MCPRRRHAEYERNKERYKEYGRRRWRELHPNPRPRGSWSLGRESPTTPRAAERPRIRDLTWVAGFLEGEGCFASGGDSIQVCAVQVQREPLDRLQRWLGGKIYERRSNNPRHNHAWVWQTSGARARGIMMTLYALMSPKRQLQIRKALAR